MSTPHLLILGLNAAWQKTLFFEQFKFNDINRADSMEELAAGKGVNAARASRNSGAIATVAQFAGGDAGQKLMAAMAAEGINDLTEASRQPTRTCTTILDRSTGSMTELIEPSPQISPAEAEALKQKLLPEFSRCDAVIISGTYPPGVPTNFYAEFIAACKDKIPVVLDAFRNIEPALQTGPDVLKINAVELDKLTSCENNIRSGISSLLKRFPITAVAVTAGPANAFIGTPCGLRKLTLPTLETVISPLGAGDTATAVFTVQMCRAIIAGKLPFPFQKAYINADTTDRLAECFADGLAAASASCLTAQPAVFDPEETRTIRQKITLNKAPKTRH